MSTEEESKFMSLETGRSDRPVWLMKCPLVVSKSWHAHASDPNPNPNPVAKVVLSVDPLRSEEPDSVKFTMELASTESANMPKNYSLNMFHDIVPMCVFSENQGRIATEGKVEHKFDMKPYNENAEEYRKLCRERTNKSMIKSRQIQVIDNDRGAHMRPMPGMVGLISSSSNKDKKKTAPMKPSDMKRTRRDRGELEDIMFKLFERQPNWALKQLVQETDQPAQFLKEILNELCIYNKRGTNQGTYELKPEYKKSAEEAEG